MSDVDLCIVSWNIGTYASKGADFTTKMETLFNELRVNQGVGENYFDNNDTKEKILVLSFQEVEKDDYLFDVKKDEKKWTETIKEKFTHNPNIFLARKKSPILKSGGIRNFDILTFI